MSGVLNLLAGFNDLSSFRLSIVVHHCPSLSILFLFQNIMLDIARLTMGYVFSLKSRNGMVYTWLYSSKMCIFMGTIMIN